jgi:cation diffusion facilitator CzcD-associated flavoprotein CzcO
MSKSLSDGPSILKYINEAADEYKVRDNIIYQQRALCYNFDTKEKLWTITTENTSTAEETIYTCQFIFSCVTIIMPKGIPQFTDQSSLKEIIHPQKWPENLNVVDKTIIVIGVELLLSLLCPS